MTDTKRKDEMVKGGGERETCNERRRGRGTGVGRGTGREQG